MAFLATALDRKFVVASPNFSSQFSERSELLWMCASAYMQTYYLCLPRLCVCVCVSLSVCLALPFCLSPPSPLPPDCATLQSERMVNIFYSGHFLWRRKKSKWGGSYVTEFCTQECRVEGFGFKSNQSCLIFQLWLVPSRSWEGFGPSGKSHGADPMARFTLTLCTRLSGC